MLILLAVLRGMKSSSYCSLAHLPGMWVGPGTSQLLRQAQEIMPLGQAMEAGAGGGGGERGEGLQAIPMDQRCLRDGT